MVTPVSVSPFKIAQLMGARFAVGAGEAALNPAAYSMIADSFPKRRLSLATSIFGAGAYVGGGVSLMIGGFLIDSLPKQDLVLPILGHLSVWRVVFIAAATPGLLVSLLAWTLADPPRRGRLAGAARMRDALVFARRHARFFCGLFLGFALLAAAGTGFQAWAPTHLIRSFGIPVSQVVSILAPIGIFAGVGGGLFAGYVCDRMIARGVRDAHLRFFLWSAMIQLVFLVLCVLSSSLLGFVVFAFIFNAASGFAGAGPAALQLVTPNNFRGQISAACLFTFSLVGAGEGPTAVGALTTYLFHDDAKVGWAIAANAMVVIPLALLCFLFALAPMRKAMDEAAAWSSNPAAA